jgi:DNA-binding transcriptional LysR family regulator
METKKVAVMLEAIRAGSLSKIAEKLGYSNSNLVHMMNALDNEVGFPLLKRAYNGVTFTEEGEKLEPYFKTLVESEAALLSQIDALKEKTAEKIRIGAFSSMVIHWLPNIVGRFLETNPDVVIELEECGIELPDMLESGKFDIGFVDAANIGKNEWIHIRKDQLYAVVPTSWPYSEDVPIHLDELIKQQILIACFNKKNAALDILRKFDVKYPLKISTYSGAALIKMVENGLGVGILSKLYMSFCNDAVRMVPTDPPFYRDIGIIVSTQPNRLPSVMKRFVACVKKSV